MEGFQILKNHFNENQQQALLADIEKVISAAPLYTPTMPKTGRPFSVQETNCGTLGWVSDKSGYRYQAHHPTTGQPWPALPNRFLKLWQEITKNAPMPEAGLINFYHAQAKMGLHQDKDEEDLNAPVVSISLGNSAKFRLGGLKRRDEATTIDLCSGDVVVLAGKARLAYHGINRIIENSSNLLDKHPQWQNGRFNVTLRRVTQSS